MGPVFQRQTLMSINGTAQPLQAVPAWQHRILAIDTLIEYSIVSTDVNVAYEVTLGSSVEVQRSPVSGGGTIGIWPSFTDVVKTIVGAAGDELAFTLFELVGGTPSVMLEVHLTPLRV